MNKRIWFPHITKTVFILSLVSLFTDIASEMLYPVMPLYLTSIGMSVAFIGILEGIAEATAGLSKGFFGHLSDQSGKRKPFVQVGYSLSALAKPLIGLWTHALWILGARTLERLGKGIRTGARDAMLSDEASTETKGRVFGFHRAFDTLGAAFGPLIALIFLLYHPTEYRMLFFVAFIPGIFAIALTFLLRERQTTQFQLHAPVSYNPFLYLSYWKKAPREYKRLIIGLLAFSFVNSSDVFLLLQVKAGNASDHTVILLYILYNLVYAAASYPFGILGDKIGLKKTFILGLGIFALVYGGMGLSHSSEVLFTVLFLLYGLYAAATEGISKAWISNSVHPNDVATAIGFYTSFQSIMTFAASSIAGWIWYVAGPRTMFGITAFVVLLIILYLTYAVPEREKK